jgi:hypothetical protein
MPLPDSFFGRKFAITNGDLEGWLADALASGGDYADRRAAIPAVAAVSASTSLLGRKALKPSPARPRARPSCSWKRWKPETAH